MSSKKNSYSPYLDNNDDFKDDYNDYIEDEYEEYNDEYEDNYDEEDNYQQKMPKKKQKPIDISNQAKKEKILVNKSQYYTVLINTDGQKITYLNLKKKINLDKEFNNNPDRSYFNENTIFPVKQKIINLSKVPVIKENIYDQKPNKILENRKEIVKILEEIEIDKLRRTLDKGIPVRLRYNITDLKKFMKRLGEPKSRSKEDLVNTLLDKLKTYGFI